jgi:hypothetical protein
MAEFSIDQLAQVVTSADGFNRQTTLAQVRHIIEIAVKTKLAFSALGNPVQIDLGNGHAMACSVDLGVIKIGMKQDD